VTVHDLTKENVSNSTDNKLVSMQFLTESNNISLINTKGDLLLLNVLTGEVISIIQKKKLNRKIRILPVGF